MNTLFKKFFLMMIVGVFIFSSLSLEKNNVTAKSKYEGFKIIQDDSKKTILEKTQDNVKVTVTYDKIKGTFKSTVVDKTTKKREDYNLLIENAVEDKDKELTYVNKQTQEKFIEENGVIKKETKKGTVQPKFAFAIPVGIAITSSAIEMLVAAGTAAVIAGVGCIAYSTFKQKKKTKDYYRTYLIGKKTYFGNGYTKGQATTKMKKNGISVWATSSQKARALSKAVSPVGKSTKSEIDAKSKGKYRHYHPLDKKKKRMKVNGESLHVFYGAPH